MTPDVYCLAATSGARTSILFATSPNISPERQNGFETALHTVSRQPR
jgi:hypothetical protein